MKKEDLKSGMWVELNNGDECMVLTNCDTDYGKQDFCLISKNSFLMSDDFTDDLINEYPWLTIDKVFNASVCNNTYSGTNKRLIWERKQFFMPKDGDICYFKNKNCERIIIFRNYESSENIKVYAVCTVDDNVSFFDTKINGKIIRPARDYEIEHLNKSLKSYGKRWNAECKIIEDIIKVGDTCICWFNEKESAVICKITEVKESRGNIYYTNGGQYYNAIKFKSIEQYEKFISQ